MTTQSKLLAFALALALPACGDTDENGDDPGAGNDFAEIAFDAARLTRDVDAPNNSARPAGVAALGDKLFVALGNLTVDCMVPAGPGYLAVVDLAAAPEAGEAGYALIELPEGCRNPQNVLGWEAGNRVFVACAGEFGWGATPSEALVAVDASSGQALFTTRLGCGAGEAECTAATPGKMAMAGDWLLVGDASSGRLFAVDPMTGAVDAARPDGVHLCDPHPETFWNMTGDIVSTDAGVFATCFATSEIVRLDASLQNATRLVLGSGAQLLAAHGAELLVGDTLDNALYALDLTQAALTPVNGSDRLGMAANQLLVDGEKAYAIASTDNAVQVIDLSLARGGDFSTARTVDQIPTASTTSPLATNTNPYAAALAGDSLFVTLLGACTPDGDAAGNRLIRIDLGGEE